MEIENTINLAISEDIILAVDDFFKHDYRNQLVKILEYRFPFTENEEINLLFFHPSGVVDHIKLIFCKENSFAAHIFLPDLKGANGFYEIDDIEAYAFDLVKQIKKAGNLDCYSDTRFFLLLFSKLIICLMNDGLLGFTKKGLNRKIKRSIENKIKLSTGQEAVNIFNTCIIKPKSFSKTYKCIIEIKQKYHLRRGHWRNYKNGEKVWIKPYFAGDEKLGKINKNYKLSI